MWAVLGPGVAVELFAGSCRLSKCLRSAGFETVAVDVKDAVGHQVLHEA